MDIFSNFQVANECLFDKKRTNIFSRAIKKTVKDGDIVVDAGTGTGILALLAAKAGAKKVYACDIADDVLLQAKNNFFANDYAEVIETVHGDIREFKAVKNANVVLMEMLDTGLIAEQQGVALNSLRENGVIGKNTKLIPNRAKSYIELIEYDFSFYGLHMPMIIQARNYGANLNIRKILSKPTLYDDVDFHKLIDTNVSKQIHIIPTNSGVCNAVRLRTRIHLSEGIWSWGTSDMNMPVILPLASQVIKKGKGINLSIKYEMGSGFDKLLIATL